MGGNALKEYNVVRLNATEYHQLVKEIKIKLITLFPEYRFDIIPAYHTKKSFGDMDILYSGKDISQFYKTIQDEFMPIGYINNGSVLSITYPINDKLFQVDFIKVKPEDHNFALRYFSYNDLGNLLGRIYHKMGLKFGHTGLKYIIRDPNNITTVIKEILITNDWEYVIQLGKFPTYNEKLFNTLEDVFLYVIQSPYFNNNIFLLENRNHISRVRDKKRISYMLFLRWIKHRKDLPEYDWTNKEEIRTNTLDILFNDFPEFKREYDNVLTDFYKHKELHQKYNGILVGRWTGLSGKELGNFMKSIKGIITSEFIDNSTDIEIENKIKELYMEIN